MLLPKIIKLYFFDTEAPSFVNEEIQNTFKDEAIGKLQHGNCSLLGTDISQVAE